MTGPSTRPPAVELPDQAPLPLVAPEELTPEWLTAALATRGFDGRVTSVGREQFGTGQVADTYRLHLGYDASGAAGPESVVGKFSARDEDSRAAATAHRLYEREVRFYERLARRLPVRTPTDHYAGIEPATGRMVLLLEDLSPAAQVDQLDGFTLEHAERAVVEAAALHAPLWGGETQLDDAEWLTSNRRNTAALAPRLAALTETFLERYADVLEPEVARVIAEVNRHTAAYWSSSDETMTVVHGDFRPDNMLFDASGGAVPIAVLDWQTVTLAPALVDVAFLLGTSLELDERRAGEDTLVERYHDALLAQGVEGYGWERCWEDYRRAAAYAVLFLTPAAAMVARTERGDEMFLTMLRRAAAQIDDLDTTSLLPT